MGSLLHHNHFFPRADQNTGIARGWRLVTFDRALRAHGLRDFAEDIAATMTEAIRKAIDRAFEEVLYMQIVGGFRDDVQRAKLKANIALLEQRRKEVEQELDEI